MHAQDRFFEMDLRRHITAGRLSELVGEDGLETDKVIRTHGLAPHRRGRSCPRSSRETRADLQAYADGVNAYLDGRTPAATSPSSTPSSGLQLPTTAIEPLDPGRLARLAQGDGLGPAGNYDDELARARLSARLTPGADQTRSTRPTTTSPPADPRRRRVVTRRPTAPPVGRAVRPHHGRHARSAPADAVAAPGDGRLTSASAQAAYAQVHDALTPPAAARPRRGHRLELLGRRPGRAPPPGSRCSPTTRTSASAMPGIWIQIGLHCRTVSQACPLDVCGFSFAGVPGVVIGHNADIAWGFTNLGPDVTDFYLERVVGDTYLRDGDWEPVTDPPGDHQGRAAAPTSASRSAAPSTARCCPTSSTGSPTPGPGLRPTRRATSNESYARVPRLDRPAAGPHRRRHPRPRPGHRLRRSSGRPRASFAVPAQNLVYADRRGPHRLPGAGPGPAAAPGPATRAGRLLAGARLGLAYDWQGFVPFAEMPWALDPEDGVHRRGEPGGDGAARPVPHRRLGLRLPLASASASGSRPRTRCRPADMAEIQIDTQDPSPGPRARTAGGAPVGVRGRPRLRRAARVHPRGPATCCATGTSPPRPATPIRRGRRLLQRRVAQPARADLRRRAADRAQGRRRRPVDARPCSGCSTNPNERVVGRQADPERHRGPDEILRQALVEARSSSPASWARTPPSGSGASCTGSTLEHPVLGGDTVPGPVRWLFNRGPHDMPRRLGHRQRQRLERQRGLRGRLGAVDADGRRPRRPRRLDAGSTRPASSGHPTDAHYADQVEDWVAGRRRSRGRSPRPPCGETDPTCSPCGRRAPAPRAEPEVGHPVGGHDGVDRLVVGLPRQERLALVEQLAGVQHDHHGRARAATRQGPVVAAAALAHPGRRCGRRPARGPARGRRGPRPPGRGRPSAASVASTGVGPVEVEVGQRDRHAAPGCRVPPVRRRAPPSAARRARRRTR